MNDTINAETNAASSDATGGSDTTDPGFNPVPPIAPAPVGPAPAVPPAIPVAGPRPLLRNPNTRLGGVASGVAQYFGLDVSLVRLLFVVFTLIAGWGVLAYVAAWIIVPKAETWPPVESSTMSAAP